MRSYRILMAVMALAGLTSLALAHGPEGSGNVGLGAAWYPMINTNFADFYGHAYVLMADAPIVSGVGVKADMGLTDVVDHQVFSGFFNADGITDSRFYNWDAFVNLYPAGFAGQAFNPGVDANADGWLWWPSAGVGYSWSRANQFRTQDFSFGGPTTHIQNVTFELDQGLTYQVTLPLATWLSAGGSFQRNLSSDFGRSDSATTNSTFGALEGEGAWVNAYINLVGGAGADANRPFLPHFGRLGQIMLGVAWQRTVTINRFLTDFSNAYQLSVGAPVASSLSVLLAVSQSNSSYGSTPIRAYQLMLTYAFGDADGRP